MILNQSDRRALIIVSVVLILVGLALVVYHGAYVLTLIGIAPVPDEAREWLTLDAVLLVGGCCSTGPSVGTQAGTWGRMREVRLGQVCEKAA